MFHFLNKIPYSIFYKPTDREINLIEVSPEEAAAKERLESPMSYFSI